MGEKWKYHPPDGPVTGLWTYEDYVISSWQVDSPQEHHLLRYRPPGEHHELGEYKTVRAAIWVAYTHHERLRRVRATARKQAGKPKTRSDTPRLDWLEIYGNTYVPCLLPGGDHGIRVQGKLIIQRPTLRQAIDAAVDHQYRQKCIDEAKQKDGQA